MKKIDCIVLSGGGAKGAFGAGAAKAVLAYKKYKGIESETCFVGTSAGALNAAVLCFLGSNELETFWKQAKKSKLLGWFPRDTRIRLGWSAVSPWQWVKHGLRKLGYQLPFSLFSNRGLRKFVSKRLSDDIFKALPANHHLIVVATNYTDGEMNGFYVSPHLERFVRKDAQHDSQDQRLQYLSRIENSQELINALLASSAIPVVYPPVQVREAGDYFVDGGIGNNTPTKEAALFLRNAENDGLPIGETYCVLLDKPGTNIESEHLFSFGDILKRSYSLFHYTHMLPIIRSWKQINRNVAKNDARVSEFIDFLDGLQNVEPIKIAEVKENFLANFEKIWSTTARQDLILNEIKPIDDLGDILDFSKKNAVRLIEAGFRAGITMLENKGKINHADRDHLLTLINKEI